MESPRVLIVLLHEYYLFEYFRTLVPALLDAGCTVTIVTYDDAIRRTFSKIHPRCRVERAPALLEPLNGRSANPFFRTILWVGAWIWARIIRRRFDVAVLTWETNAIGYAVSRSLPAVLCYTTTDFYDLNEMIAHHVWRPGNGIDGHSWTHAALCAIDRVCGRRLLPRVGGVVQRYRASHLLVDRCMGFRAENYFGDLRGPVHRTVTGHRIKEHLIAIGASAERVHVVGQPGFDQLYHLRETFNATARAQFRRELHVSLNSTMFVLFLSPSRFTTSQLDEIALVIGTITQRCPSAYLVVKLHPKTAGGELERLMQRLEGMRNQIQFITAFMGDAFNAQLILASDWLVQKQCSLGFLAMMYGVPIISYNILTTNYEDEMYAALDGSIHVRSVEQLAAVLDRLDDDAMRRDLRERQRIACERFCLATDTASARVANVVRELASLRARQLTRSE